MSDLQPTEQLVEDVGAVYFGAIGAATRRGVEIDDAGGRLSAGQAGGGATEVVLKGRLGAALHRLNPDLPHDTIGEVVRILSRPPHPTLIQNNRWFHALLTDGVEVESRHAGMGDGTGETRGGRARLVDFDNPSANELLVVRQLSVAGASGKLIRPDLAVFLNGLPVAVIELKDPTVTRAGLGVAVDQFNRYMQVAPDLFVPSMVLVASDGMLTRVGSITSGRAGFMPWRPLDDDGVNKIGSGLLPVDTVPMSSRAPVGCLAIAGVPTAINQGFIGMVCDGPLQPTYVLNWAFTSMDAIKAHASSTTSPEISRKIFRPLPVVVPTGDVIAAYRQTADPLFEMLTASVQENVQLLSGEIRVEEAERTAGVMA